MLEHDVDLTSRILAKLLRELLAVERFESFADLTDALKSAFARRYPFRSNRLTITDVDITDAYRIVRIAQANQSLLADARKSVAPRVTRALPLEPDVLPRSEATCIMRALLRRHKHESTGETSRPPLTTDEAVIVDRLSALPEPSILEFFWFTLRQCDDRLGLLRLVSHVVVERPPTWDPAAVRLDRKLRRWPDPADRPVCFGCVSWNRLYFHHVIEVQHGGSNAVRNLVPLCFRCHRYVHPWLVEDGHASGTVVSVASMADRIKATGELFGVKG